MKVSGETIKLYNRYGDDVRLDRIGRSKYMLNAPDGSMRIIYQEDNKSIFAIDPSGGPFMSVGSCLDDYIYKYKKTRKYITAIEQDENSKKFIITTRRGK